MKKILIFNILFLNQNNIKNINFKSLIILLALIVKFINFISKMDETNKLNLNLNENQRLLIGLDIGGSLTKLCIITNKNEKDINDFILTKNIFENIDLNEYNLFLASLHTNNFEKDVIKVIKDLNSIVKINKINLTGGGAYKFNDLLKQNFDIELIKHDELQSLINGYKLMNKYNNNIFYEIDNDQIKTVLPEDLTFPNITSNIGSGVSILKVSSGEKYERVGGTLMGGGTLIGLSKLIIGIDDYDKILELASRGNYENVDITKKDLIKEKDDENSENNIIGCLGKVQDYILDGKKNELKKEDIALSLLNMICSHISQYSVLYAEKNNIDTIYYFGTFTKNNSFANKLLSKSSKHWNKSIKIRFSNCGGYLGVIGTLLNKTN